MALTLSIAALSCLQPCVQPVLAKAERIPPVDLATKDPSLVQFRTQLLTILANHDKKALMGVLDRDVSYGNGGPSGITEFLKNWNINDRNDKLWTDLPNCLKHGGYFDDAADGGAFCAPYYRFYTKDDPGTDEHLRAIAKESNVPFKAQPEASASTLKVLDYEIVDVANDNKAGAWTKVATLDGKVHGWVESKHLRLATDNFVKLQKKGGKWKIVFYGSMTE